MAAAPRLAASLRWRAAATAETHREAGAGVTVPRCRPPVPRREHDAPGRSGSVCTCGRGPTPNMRVDVAMRGAPVAAVPTAGVPG